MLALRHPTSKSTTADSTVPSHSTSSSSSPPAHPSSTHAAGATSTTPGQPSTAGPSPKAIPLVVLNDTTVTHLASDAATLFEQAGWKVTSSGNYQNNIASTCAYYDPSYPGALAAANLLKSEFPSIVRVKPKFSGLAAGPIVVVLTPGFTTA